QSAPLLLDALSRAAAAPHRLPLFGTRAAPGLFPGTASGRAAAQLAREHGLVRVVRTETRGKTTREIVAVTETGLTMLCREGNPKRLLQELIEALAARRQEIGTLLSAAQQM